MDKRKAPLLAPNIRGMGRIPKLKPSNDAEPAQQSASTSALSPRPEPSSIRAIPHNASSPALSPKASLPKAGSAKPRAGPSHVTVPCTNTQAKSVYINSAMLKDKQASRIQFTEPHQMMAHGKRRRLKSPSHSSHSSPKPTLKSPPHTASKQSNNIIAAAKKETQHIQRSGNVMSKQVQGTTTKAKVVPKAQNTQNKKCFYSSYTTKSHIKGQDKIIKLIGEYYDVSITQASNLILKWIPYKTDSYVTDKRQMLRIIQQVLSVNTDNRNKRKNRTLAVDCLSATDRRKLLKLNCWVKVILVYNY